MDIFNNEHEVISIGGLNIENRLDKVVIYGDVEIDKSANAMHQAKLLHDFTTSLLAALTALQDKDCTKQDGQHAAADADTSSANAKTDASGDYVDNPFL